MTEPSRRSPRLPPRVVIVAAWAIHRAVHRLTGGRRGLWVPKPQGWGALRLTTIGRRTGRERVAIVGYFEDGPNLVTLAMNGWAAPDPAWWLNLQAQPNAIVELKDGGSHPVRARAAEGTERDRLWAHWRDLGDDVDGYAIRRPAGTAVVVLEPRRSDA